MIYTIFQYFNKVEYPEKMQPSINQQLNSIYMEKVIRFYASNTITWRYIHPSFLCIVENTTVYRQILKGPSTKYDIQNILNIIWKQKRAKTNIMSSVASQLLRIMQLKFIVTFYSCYWTLNNYLQKVVAVCCAMAWWHGTLFRPQKMLHLDIIYFYCILGVFPNTKFVFILSPNCL